jgi:hypothetical protein
MSGIMMASAAEKRKSRWRRRELGKSAEENREHGLDVWGAEDRK